MKSISVCIVLFHSDAEITSLLDQLLRPIYQNYIQEIILIDNGVVRTKIPKGIFSSDKVYYYRSPLNLGFAVANNFASSISVGKSLLFLNPDCLILEEEEFIDVLQSNSSLSYIGTMENCKPWSNLSSKPGFRKFLIGLDKFPINFRAFYFDGSFILVDKTSFLEIGGFEKLFLYGEDLLVFDELVGKLKCRIVGNGATIAHNRGASSSKLHLFLVNKIFAEYLYVIRTSMWLFPFYFLFRTLTFFLIISRDLILLRLTLLFFLRLIWDYVFLIIFRPFSFIHDRFYASTIL